MPVSIQEIFNQFDVKIGGRERWGMPIRQEGPGVYIISTSDNPNQNGVVVQNPSFAIEVIDSWRTYVPGLTLNGLIRPTSEQIISELGSHWHPNENILYVGKADNLKIRIGKYYNHIVGKRSPHRGGYWLKTLSDLKNFHVYWGKHVAPKVIEEKMLKYFVECKAGNAWHDIANPFGHLPFANLEIKGECCGKKRHNLRYAVR